MRKNLFNYLTRYYFIQAMLFCLLSFGYVMTISISGGAKTWLFTATTIIGYMGFLGFLPGFILMGLLSLILPFKRLIVFCNYIVSSCFLLFLALDVGAFYLYNTHINMYFIHILLSPARFQFFDFTPSMIFSIVLLAVIILAVQFQVTRSVYKKVFYKQAGLQKKTFITAFLAALLCLVTSNAIHAWSDATSNTPVLLTGSVFPAYYGLTARRFLSNHHFISAKQIYDSSRMNHLSSTAVVDIHYPKHPLQYTANAKNTPNIMFVFVDMWRFDMMNAHTSPFIYKLSQKNLNFTQQRSGGDSTQPGIFSIFYALPANYYNPTSQAHIAPVWFDVLKHYKYDVRIDQSASMYMPSFYTNVFSSVKLPGLTTPGATSWQRDRYIAHDMIHFINEKHHHPFFGYMFFDAVHGYNYPKSYEKFKPAREINQAMAAVSRNRQPYINSYKNAVGYVDDLIHQVVDALKRKGVWNNTILVITSDHGEEFNDYGLGHWGHDINLTPIETHVPLIIHWPGHAPHQYHYLTTHYDIMPTLLSGVFHIKNAFSDYSVGHSLFNDANRYPFIISKYMYQGIVAPKNYALLMDGLYAVYNNRGQVIGNSSFADNDLIAGYSMLHAFSHRS